MPVRMNRAAPMISGLALFCFAAAPAAAQPIFPGQDQTRPGYSYGLSSGVQEDDYNAPPDDTVAAAVFDEDHETLCPVTTPPLDVLSVAVNCT